MAELIFCLGRQHTKAVAESIGDEQGIVAKSAFALLLREQPAFDTAVGDVQHAAIAREGHAAAEASGERRLLWQTGSECGFQLGAIGGGIRIFASVARAAHSRRAIESIDLKTGIVCEHEQARSAAAAALCFDASVGLEGVARFFIENDVGMGAQIFDLPCGAENGGDFFRFVSVGGGENEPWHEMKSRGGE